ncbi:MAG: hypothetical protein K2X35_12020 [Bryobacteraceae bacterium]|nr:hypothetical protein [Bryobacteraceae bacterium]
MKQQAVSNSAPLLLFEAALRDGTVERFSTHRLTFEGNAYEPRVVKHNVLDLRLSSDEGLDSMSTVRVRLSNVDSRVSQIERSIGWKGAKLTLRFLFWDVEAGAAASDAELIYRGVAAGCEEIAEAAATVSFYGRLALQRVGLPEVRIQRRCPWQFPSDAAERVEARDGASKGRHSALYRCGYSADLEGGAGNLNGGVAFVSCDYTRTACIARGMFDRDQLLRVTRRFGGVEFVPATIQVRSHGDRDWQASAVTENEARYNDFVPLVYGTAWYRPPVVFARNDGNLTRVEVLLGMGEIDGVVKVVVEDVEIPQGVPGADMTPTGWYELITAGARTGAFNPNFAGTGEEDAGDPYGSMAMLSVVTPNRISNGKKLPKIEVLVRGMKLERFDAGGLPAGASFTNNPAWVLLDVLLRSGWKREDIDLASFSAAAQYCGELIPVTDLNGNPATTPRYQCNVVIRKRRPAAEIVKGIRAGSNLLLHPAPGGKLRLRVEGPIAAQHAVKPGGSNAAEPLNGGWPAYEFSDQAPISGILRSESGAPLIRLWSRSGGDSPNRLSVEFQNEFNEYQQDSLSLAAMDDIDAVGHEVAAPVAALGLPNFDQAARILRLQLDKAILGNTFVELETTYRGFGISPGDLITVTYGKEGLNRAPFRVTRIEPFHNYERARITAQWHSDDWYTGTGVGYAGGRRERPSGTQIPRPLVGTMIRADGGSDFDIAETAGGGPEESGRLKVRFAPPARSSESRAGVPLIGLSPEVETLGGGLAGNQVLYYAVSGVDGEGREGPLSFTAKAALGGGTNTNRVRLTRLGFPGGAVAFRVYRGPSPTQLLRIASDMPLAAEFEDAGGQTLNATPPPDMSYHHANFYWRFELQPPAGAGLHGPNSIGNVSLNMLPGNYAGQVVRVVSGRGRGQERQVTGNSGTTLTVTPPWVVEPDATSEFVVAESSWRFGAITETDSAEFEFPARTGAVLQVMGRSANARNEESGAETAPVSRWQISLAQGDSDVPPEPFFGLHTFGQGGVELQGVGFSSLANTTSISGGTLTLYVWNEIASPSPIGLAQAINPTEQGIVLSAGAPVNSGDLLQIGGEILRVDSVDLGSSGCTVSRASHGSIAASHGAGTKVYRLEKRTFIVPFLRSFFGSQASGSFTFPLTIPDVRIGAADFFVTNRFGNSAVARSSFTGTTDAGLRTLSGGQLSMTIEGYLAMQNDAAPAIEVEATHAVRDVFARVREAPTGGNVQLRLRQGASLVCDLTIAAGNLISNVIDGFGLAPLATGVPLSLDIVAVPAGTNTMPGRDLTVTLRR